MHYKDIISYTYLVMTPQFPPACCIEFPSQTQTLLPETQDKAGGLSSVTDSLLLDQLCPSLDPIIFSKITEDLEEVLFIWIISTDIYQIRN